LPPDVARNPPPYLRGAAKPRRMVVGGARRQDSVSHAFAAAAAASDLFLIHDAARPFVSADLIGRTIAAAAAHGAAIAAIAASDTVKRVRPWAARPWNPAAGGLDHVVQETLDRETIYLAQTPQGFRRDVLAAAVALGQSGVEATDEAALAERAGYPVHLVAGEPNNVKITTAEDLDAARRRMLPARTGRVGTAYD